MSDVLRSFQAMLEGAGYVVALPLVLLCALLWILLAERAAALGLAPWELCFPAARRRRREAEAKFQEALQAYLADPQAAEESRLVECSLQADGPEPLLVRRSLAVEGKGSGLPLQVRLRGAFVLGIAEIRSGTLLIRSLAHATLLAGILASVTGLETTLRALSVSGVHDESLWFEAAPGVVMGSGLAVAALVPAFLGQVWIAHWVARRSREIEVRHAALSRVLESRVEGVLW